MMSWTRAHALLASTPKHAVFSLAWPAFLTRQALEPTSILITKSLKTIGACAPALALGTPGNAGKPFKSLGAAPALHFGSGRGFLGSDSGVWDFLATPLLGSGVLLVAFLDFLDFLDFFLDFFVLLLCGSSLSLSSTSLLRRLHVADFDSRRIYSSMNKNMAKGMPAPREPAVANRVPAPSEPVHVCAE